MDAYEKLRVLVSEAVFECEGGKSLSAREVQQNKEQRLWESIYHAKVAGGTMPLLKTLLTSACIKNCRYCPIAAYCDHKVVSFKPDEMAQMFMAMHKAGLVKGLFLSSGIVRDPDTTQELLNDTAKILRTRYGFRGYIHLKIMPGASLEAIVEASRWSNRISVNAEAPNEHRLTKIAPEKSFQGEILPTLKSISEVVMQKRLKFLERIAPIQRIGKGWLADLEEVNEATIPPILSSTTQFVVGAAGETDRELLQTAVDFYRRFNLGRVYFSAFQPICGTLMENAPAEKPVRERRLYQADFLMRLYGFDLNELIFDERGNLPQDIDPKLAWALQNLERFPVEITKAEREELLRVPGIGTETVDRIIKARKEGALINAEDLQRLGVRLKRAAPFLTLNGKLLTKEFSVKEPEPTEQLHLL
ncbi:MAG: radical SAM protein [Armatimonadetes bacterium]|nr:radical SAM protein [Armatimonadota bacterium]MDW8029672.1 radical SAM protein [Armatimonadota bacterium]